MKRFITAKLIEWKNSQDRKNLILKGTRQVGKTYILQEFGKNNYDKEIPKLFESMLIEKLKAYYIVEGMSEGVYSWVNNKDIEKVNKLQQNILDTYEADFSKHVDTNEANKISLIWNGIPSQLARENKKFVYQLVKEGARAREYENALNWLKDSNLISKCFLVNKCAFPLKAYNDLSAYKIYMLDVGLLRKMANLDSSIILESNKLFEEFKGSFTENYVVNVLNYLFNSSPNYYTFDRNEIDFVIQIKNKIIPIEIKSNKSTNHNSLTKYNANNDNELSFRFSLNNLSKDGKIINIPLYFIEYICNLNIY